MKPAVAFLLKGARRLVQAAGVGYPISLLAVAAALRFVGEAWWVSTVGLYLPRIGFALPLPFLVVALGAFRMRGLLRLQAISLVLIVFPLMGFVLPLPSPVDRSRPTVRVLSFNVDSGRAGAEAVVGEIDRYDPDIVVLQEIGGNEAFRRLLSPRYPTVDVSSQFVMATRYPLSAATGAGAVPTEALERSRGFQRRVLETPLGPIVLYNVHTLSPRGPLYRLRGPRGLPREVLSGRFFQGQGAPAIESNAGVRASQVQAFAEAAAQETDPVILAGDTNLPDLSPVLSRYLSSYEDGFTRAGWGFGYTFPTNKWRPWMRIDRVLAKDPLRFVRFDVGRAVVSDHLCVVADLQRR
jgi:endonuclease/exonuclease/phosphatase (EEP) superfamily protein YafD